MGNGSKWAALTSLLVWQAMAPLPANTEELANPDPWLSPELVGHPLTGRIWDARREAFITQEQLASSLSGIKYLLLGEKHDNPDHHVLQLTVLELLRARQQLFQVSFEMLDSAVMERLLDLYLQSEMNAAELQAYLMWDAQAWDWAFYGPLVQAAYTAGVPIAAGNITRERINSIYADAEAGGAQVLDARSLAQLESDIDESHCGMLPESQFPAMVRVQQARDRAMAASLRVPGRGATSVLIAGNYHIRRDIGVPNYLRVPEPSSPLDAIVALAFMEVQAGEEAPAAYQQQFSERRAFDYIWFTPSVGEEDYCASMRQ